MTRRDLFTFSDVAKLCVWDKSNFLTKKDFIRSKNMKRKKRKRFNYFIPWLRHKTNPFMMYNVLLYDIYDVIGTLERICL